MTASPPAVRAELTRIRDLHLEIAERLEAGETELVRERFEAGFMTPAFQRECAADYDRWIAAFDQMEKLLRVAA